MKNTLQMYEDFPFLANNQIKKRAIETLFKHFATPFKISLQKKRFHLFFFLHKHQGERRGEQQLIGVGFQRCLPHDQRNTLKQLLVAVGREGVGFHKHTLLAIASIAEQCPLARKHPHSRLSGRTLEGLHQADHAIPPLPFCLTCRQQLHLNALALANRELQKVLTKRVEATLAVEFIVDFSCQSGIG